jgi:Ner family transcriptional regulator
MMNTSRETLKKDWHPADIKAALEKEGWNFARIAREYSFINRRSPGNVLRIPWARTESIIGEIIGIPPAEIWPSRYDEKGQPIKRRSNHPIRVPKRKGPRND